MVVFMHISMSIEPSMPLYWIGQTESRLIQRCTKQPRVRAGNYAMYTTHIWVRIHDPIQGKPIRGSYGWSSKWCRDTAGNLYVSGNFDLSEVLFNLFFTACQHLFCSTSVFLSTHWTTDSIINKPSIKPITFWNTYYIVCAVKLHIHVNKNFLKLLLLDLPTD